jgi:hypothetical protein
MEFGPDFVADFQLRFTGCEVSRGEPGPAWRARSPRQ